MFPSSYVIAVAIYAAARELQLPNMPADTLAVMAASGAKDRGGGCADYPLARTRCYAGVALWEAFPEASRKWIGRCMAQPCADVWASKLEKDLRAGSVRWWDDDIAERVRAAVDWAIEKERPLEIPAILRPAASERQIKARNLLEEAMRNTAALPVPPA